MKFISSLGIFFSICCAALADEEDKCRTLDIVVLFHSTPFGHTKMWHDVLNPLIDTVTEIRDKNLPRTKDAVVWKMAFAKYADKRDVPDSDYSSSCLALGDEYRPFGSAAKALYTLSGQRSLTSMNEQTSALFDAIVRTTQYSPHWGEHTNPNGPDLVIVFGSGPSKEAGLLTDLNKFKFIYEEDAQTDMYCSKTDYASAEDVAAAMGNNTLLLQPLISTPRDEKPVAAMIEQMKNVPLKHAFIAKPVAWTEFDVDTWEKAIMAACKAKTLPDGCRTESNFVLRESF